MKFQLHVKRIALKCKTLSTKCNSIMQVALLAEPKSRACLRAVTKCAGIFVHTMKNCYYTLLKQALSVTHARKGLVVYGRNAENEPISRIKMADYNRVLESMGTL